MQTGVNKMTKIVVDKNRDPNLSKNLGYRFNLNRMNSRIPKEAKLRPRLPILRRAVIHGSKSKDTFILL